jgi:hypothetical protein
MNEVARCYLEGFGTKKDKVSHTLLHSRCRHFLRAIASPIRGRPARTLCQLDNSGVLAHPLSKSP